MDEKCEQALQRLLRYCRSEAWVGYDPYDGLSSPLARLSFFESRLPRTLLTQLVKRSPINLHPILSIKKEFNSKGIALAARALMLLADREGISLPQHLREPAYDDARNIRTEFEFLMNRLGSLRSNNYEQACWGYGFDWQSRAFFAPRGTPNVVCTVFAGHAYLDWHDRTGSEFALDTAKSACRFLLDVINRTRDRDGFCFSYTPLDHSRVHNVNLLAAELLARAYAKTGADEYAEAARHAAAFTVARQSGDGSWAYGEAPSQKWIDSFHTGFVLVSLKHLIDDLGVEAWRPALDRGYEFYRARFFLADGTPGYYHDRRYPLDIHSAAQGVTTFVEMKDLMPDAMTMASRVVRWAVENLQDPAGFFYFQKHRLYTIKTSYMRWAQAWMLYALSLYLTGNRKTENV